MDEIHCEIKYLAAQWPARRVLSVVPIHHIYGYLWTVLLANYLRVEVVNVRGWGTESFRRLLRQGDLVVAYPGAWQRWRDVEWQAGVMGVSSSGGMPAGMAAQLLAKGLGRWSEIYGCTELGAIGFREGLDLQFRLAPYWPDRLAGIEAPDNLKWHDARNFSLGERKDGSVKVSGMLVDLDAVRGTLLEMKGIRAIGLRIGDKGLEAIIAGDVDLGKVKVWMEERLPPWERPRIVSIGSTLPVDERGKLLFDLETSVDV